MLSVFYGACEMTRMCFVLFLIARVFPILRTFYKSHAHFIKMGMGNTNKRRVQFMTSAFNL